MKILIVENLNPDESIWWWKYLPPLSDKIQLSTAKIPEKKFKKSLIPLLKLYTKLNNYDIVITHQDGYATLSFSFQVLIPFHSIQSPSWRSKLYNMRKIMRI